MLVRLLMVLSVGWLNGSIRACAQGLWLGAVLDGMVDRGVGADPHRPVGGGLVRKIRTIHRGLTARGCGPVAGPKPFSAGRARKAVTRPGRRAVCATPAKA